MSDIIKNPDHYTHCSIECIDAMRIAFGSAAVYQFCLMNTFKYLWRHKHKNGLEDLQKAGQYLDMAKDTGEPADGRFFDLLDVLKRYGGRRCTDDISEAE